MKVIIAGSRHYTDPVYTKFLREAVEASGIEITELVCGMAGGIDSLARTWATMKGIPVKEFPADWRKHGKAAGPLRNQEMAEYAEALIAIWDGVSPGTHNMIREAKKRGLKVEIFYPGGM